MITELNIQNITIFSIIPVPSICQGQKKPHCRSFASLRVIPVPFLMTRLRSEHHQQVRGQGWRQARALLPHRGPHGPRLRRLRDRETGESHPLMTNQNFK